MAWENRDYNRGGGGGDDYLSNPAGILGFSVPFGTWLGVRVRLHFWLLLTIGISLFGLTRGASLVDVLLSIGLLLVALLLHDFGHRVFTYWVGGRHDEFMLWPAGGMEFPKVPPGAGPLFVSHVGGMATNFALGILSLVAAAVLTGSRHVPLSLNPFTALGTIEADVRGGFLAYVLVTFAEINWGIVLINFLPYYWFDGGYLLQSILWPFLGAYQAINITCWVGMILAVPMLILTIPNLLGMIMWVLLFSSAYTRRKQLQAEGTGELESAIAYSAQDVGVTAPKRRKWLRPGWAQSAVREAQREREEQATIDAILAKVSAQGMQSLTSKEKRTLQKATERQRRRGS